MNNLFKKLLLASTVLCGVMSTNSIYSMESQDININNISDTINATESLGMSYEDFLHNVSNIKWGKKEINDKTDILQIFSIFAKILGENTSDKTPKEIIESLKTPPKEIIKSIESLYKETISAIIEYTNLDFILDTNEQGNITVLKIIQNAWDFIIKYIKNKAQKGNDFDSILQAMNKNLYPKLNYLRTKISLPNLGLANMGAICYMNAILQCLSNISDFNSKLLNLYPKLNNKNQKLTINFCEVLDNILPSITKTNNMTYYPPNNFHNTIAQNPLFANMASNLKDLIQSLIETMHNELNVNKNNKTKRYQPNQTNKEEMKDRFMKESLCENKSEIFDQFYATEFSADKYMNCNTIVYNFYSYNLLLFPLMEVKNCVNINWINLEDCFKYYLKFITPYIGDNQNYCNICKQLQDSLYVTQIESLPKTLILIMYRGKNNQDLVSCKFPQYIEFEKNGTIYKRYLSGIVCHVVKSRNSDYFFSYCRKNASPDKWYKYNDAVVTKAENNEIQALCNKELKNTTETIPYILFYNEVSENDNKIIEEYNKEHKGNRISFTKINIDDNNMLQDNTNSKQQQNNNNMLMNNVIMQQNQNCNMQNNNMMMNYNMNQMQYMMRQNQNNMNRNNVNQNYNNNMNQNYNMQNNNMMMNYNMNQMQYMMQQNQNNMNQNNNMQNNNMMYNNNK